MRVSLVMCSVGRTSEPQRLMYSLVEQEFRDFELIVVDQNEDDRLENLCREFGHLDIVYVRSERGLSKARNKGIEYITGEVVAFPDDDCWYPPGLLRSVTDFLDSNPNIDGLTGVSVDENGRLTGGRWDRRSGRIGRVSAWSRAISYTLFLRTSVVGRVGEFDRRLGLGAATPWGSAEETDYILRAIACGCHLAYRRDLFVYHVPAVTTFDSSTLKRAVSYSRGQGFVLKKHQLPLWFVFLMTTRPLLRWGAALVRGRLSEAAHYQAIASYRLRGWRDTSPDLRSEVAYLEAKR